MTSEERDLITGLFNRLRAADTTSKDQEAEQLIGQLTGGQPGAPYRLVQTLLVQEHALNNATVRIQQLEKQVAQAQAAAQPAAAKPGRRRFSVRPVRAPCRRTGGATAAHRSRYPFRRNSFRSHRRRTPNTRRRILRRSAMAPSAGSGFLRGALQTAAGVAGGSLIAQGIESLMGHHSGPFGGGYGGGADFSAAAMGGAGAVESSRTTTEVVNNNYIEERGGDRGSRGRAAMIPAIQETQRENNRRCRRGTRRRCL